MKKLFFRCFTVFTVLWVGTVCAHAAPDKLAATVEPTQTSPKQALQAPTTVRGNSVIDLVYMGGPDCPPCRNWKIHDLPKLRESKGFPHIRFTEVKKWIRDPIPDAADLPEHLRPMRDELVRTVNRTKGSPFFALLVDGNGVKGGFGTGEYESLLPIIGELVARKLTLAAKPPESL